MFPWLLMSACVHRPVPAPPLVGLKLPVAREQIRQEPLHLPAAPCTNITQGAPSSRCFGRNRSSACFGCACA
jgi:hypothetical protein